MEIFYERKVQMNQWLMKARWFYGLGIIVIGVISKTLKETNVNFSIIKMLFLLSIFYFINIAFILYLRWILKRQKKEQLQTLSYMQMVLELFICVLITHSSGTVESMAYVFFFMPIVSAAFLFGTKGSIITGLISGVLFNSMVILENKGIISHVYRYGIPTIETIDLSVALTKSLSTAAFYVIIGFYAGFGSKMLFQREEMLNEKNDQIQNINKELDSNIKNLHDERRKAEEAHNKTAAIISNLADPIIVLDKNNKINVINPAARHVLGLSHHDIGREVDSKNNFSMENFTKVISKLYRVKKIIDDSKNKNSYEELVVNYNNQDQTYKVTTAKIIDYKEEYLGTMKVFYNLTREKMIDRMKSEFITIAAHQLRTPLSAIKWCIKLVLDEDEGKINEGQKAALTKGYISNERVITLVNDMLNVSRIEEGRFGYSFNEDSIDDALKIVLTSVEKEVENRKINLIIKKDENLPLVLMDKEKMVLVLQNIIENAVKYTPENGKIEMNVHLDDIEKNKILVKVKDNGVGIPKEDQKKMFSKFFRADNVIRIQTEGSGLGLFICKNIIESHGGKIGFNSEEGIGSEFIISLPIGENKAKEKARTEG